MANGAVGGPSIGRTKSGVKVVTDSSGGNGVTAGRLLTLRGRCGNLGQGLLRANGLSSGLDAIPYRLILDSPTYYGLFPNRLARKIAR